MHNAAGAQVAKCRMPSSPQRSCDVQLARDGGLGAMTGGGEGASTRGFTSGAEEPGSVGPGTDAPRGADCASSPRHSPFCLSVLWSVRPSAGGQTPLTGPSTDADGRPHLCQGGAAATPDGGRCGSDSPRWRYRDARAGHTEPRLAARGGQGPSRSGRRWQQVGLIICEGVGFGPC